MRLYPAIDLKEGKCVRLLQGRMEDATVFNNNPAEQALLWQSLGAEYLHLVDLDGAFKKSPQNLEAVKNILATVNIPVQLGGGVRDEATLSMYFSLGVSRLIIGTAAVKDPLFVKRACSKYPGKIVVGLDAKNGFVAVNGWAETSAIRAVNLAREFEDTGVAAIIFTDIARDGMQTGPNLEDTAELAAAVNIPVIVSGGFASINDIEHLLKYKERGIEGAILGRSIYTGAIDLKTALALAKANA